MSGKVRALEEVTDLYAVRGIDEMHDKRFAALLQKFIYSRFVYDLRYRKLSKSIEDHIKESGRYIYEYALHSGIKRVKVIPAYADTSAEGLCRRYSDALVKSWDKQQEIPLEISKPWTKEYTYEAPGEDEGLVILVHSGDTAFSTLDHISGYSQDYKAVVVGAVLLED